VPKSPKEAKEAEIEQSFAWSSLGKAISYNFPEQAGFTRPPHADNGDCLVWHGRQPDI